MAKLPGRGEARRARGPQAGARAIAMLQSDCLPTLVQEELERMITAANLAFHDRLVALAGNAKLPAACRRLVNELALCRRTALALRDTVPVSARRGAATKPF